MPSKDTYHEENPKTNEWMEKELVSSDRAKRPENERAVSGQIQRLADRTGQDAADLADKIPPDTVRRTKYPVHESVTEDGKRVFRHDLGIVEGPKTSIR